jgi:hypothetical protein
MRWQSKGLVFFLALSLLLFLSLSPAYSQEAKQDQQEQSGLGYLYSLEDVLLGILERNPQEAPAMEQAGLILMQLDELLRASAQRLRTLEARLATLPPDLTGAINLLRQQVADYEQELQASWTLNKIQAVISAGLVVWLIVK